MPIAPIIRNWPLRTKLLAIAMVTTAAALALAGVGIVISDSILFNQYLERDLTALSQIIADNSTGALAFDDADAAGETLGALRARNHLVAACIYRANGTVLARYSRTGATLTCPAPSARERIEFLADAVSVSRPVALAGRPIGTFTMAYDYGEIWERRRIYGSAVIAILLVTGLLAALLSRQLRNLIAEPVSKLVSTVDAVSKTRNYGLRAERISGGELGMLVDAFNEMLSRIQARDEELRKALADREEANKRLAQSNSDLERFAFVASHDLQEPLRMVTLYTQLLRKRSVLDASPETAEYVANIIGGTRRMHELLNDIRVYAEIRTDEDLTPVDLNGALQNAMANLKLVIEQSGAQITSDPLPSLRAYEAHFVALFQNLIGNAIKYRADEPPRISISCRHDGTMLRFAVSDNGIGIAPEYHTSIFVPFKRLHGAEIPGTGIGLAICQRVVERYGGHIWVESEALRGATFHFTFPEAIAAPAPELNRSTA